MYWQITAFRYFPRFNLHRGRGVCLTFTPRREPSSQRIPQKQGTLQAYLHPSCKHPCQKKPSAHVGGCPGSSRVSAHPCCPVLGTAGTCCMGVCSVTIAVLGSLGTQEHATTGFFFSPYKYCTSRLNWNKADSEKQPKKQPAAAPSSPCSTGTPAVTQLCEEPPSAPGSPRARGRVPRAGWAAPTTVLQRETPSQRARGTTAASFPWENHLRAAAPPFRSLQLPPAAHHRPRGSHQGWTQAPVMKFPSKDLLGLTALWKTRAPTKQGVH